MALENKNRKEGIMARFDELIRKGNELRGTDMGSPRFSLWANDVRAAVAPYGESTTTILEEAFSSGIVIMGGPNLNDDAINAVNELLESLNERQPEDTRAQDAIINQKKAEVKQTLGAKFQGITVHGDATFGDSSPMNKVTVGELITTLVNEVEALPDSEDKQKLLSGLKSVLSNPTFAGVAATMISETLKRAVFGTES